MKKYLAVLTFLFLAVSNDEASAATKVVVARELFPRANSWWKIVDYNAAHATLSAIEANTSVNIPGDLNGLFVKTNFNPNDDDNLVRGVLSSFYTRKAFMNLKDAGFVDVVGNSLPFFSTPFGFSLIHGWMLARFSKSTTPYYIGRYFSFDKFFLGMINAMPTTVQNVTKRAWAAASKNIERDEDSRWAYYHHMMYLPYAIEQVSGSVDKTAFPSMDQVIMGARISKTADLKFYNQNLESFWLYVKANTSSSSIQKEVFANIMGWVISHYDIEHSPVFAKINEDTFDINTFVEFVIEHIPALNEEPIVGGKYKSEELAGYVQKILEELQNVYGTHTLSFVKSCINEVVEKNSRSSSKRAGRIAIDQTNFGIGFEKIFKTKKNEGLKRSPTAHPEQQSMKTPTKPIAAWKEGGEGITWSSRSPLAESDKLQSRFEEYGIYITPVDWTYTAEGDISIRDDDSDQQLAANQRFLDGLGRYQLADILKTWETYLDKGKRYTVPTQLTPQKDPMIEGTSVAFITKRAQLSLTQVKKWRHALLATNGALQVTDIRKQMMIDGPKTWREHMIGNMEREGFMKYMK